MVSRLISWALAVMCFGFIAPLAQAAADAPVKGVDPIEISHGAKVKLKKFLVPGKTTVFDFYSTFCPVCMETTFPPRRSSRFMDRTASSVWKEKRPTISSRAG